VHGPGSGKWNRAVNKNVTCWKVIGNKWKCTASARPCK
jgi:hypothetical protein